MSKSSLPRSQFTAPLRERLAQGRPQFAAAVEKEQRVEQFCQNIRAQLREQRERFGLEQSAVAAKLEIGQPAVSRLENGSGDIGLKTLFRYADAIGVKPLVLFIPSERQIKERLDQARDETKHGPSTRTPAEAAQEAQESLLRALSESFSESFPDIAVKLTAT